MKPVYLAFCGINSFSERAEIDFNRLLQYGIFGIFGDTGSGKSTILDCIGFAVYGDVARTRSGSIADVIHYKQDKAYVHFEFEIIHQGERRFIRIEREIKRKNATQSAHVYEKKEEKWVSCAEGVRDCNAFLKDLIGLEQKDFEKCIALPQGEFAQFVKASRADRLKLIARLFDLEAYGERLTKRVNARASEASKECEILQTKLEPYEGVSQQANEQLQALIAGQKNEIERRKTQLEELRKQKALLETLLGAKKEWGELSVKLRELEGQREEMETLSSELDLLEGASLVLKAQQEVVQAQTNVQNYQAHLIVAEKGKQQAEENERLALEQFPREELQAEIERLSESRVRAEQYESIVKKCTQAKQELERVRNEYRTEQGKFPAFSYETEKAKLEAEKERLGEGDFFAFINQQGKQSLFTEEYGLFAQQLKQLLEKHPQIEGDVLPLIAHYVRLSQAEKIELSALEQEFKRVQKERKELEKRLQELEQQNAKYQIHLNNLSSLEEKGKRYKTDLEELNRQLEEMKALSVSEIDSLIKEKKLQMQSGDEKCRKVAELRADAVAAYATLQGKVSEAIKRLEDATSALDRTLKSGGFESVAVCSALVEKYGDATKAKKRLTDYRTEYGVASKRYAELSQNDYSQVSEERYEEIKKQAEEVDGRLSSLTATLAVNESEFTRNQAALEVKRKLETELKKAQSQAQIFERLKKLLSGNKFMEFVAEEYLQNVAASASGRLLSLTDGRYFLRYDGGFFVGDNFNGGAVRGVHTLSGGETFLVSLSLALSLSAEICARSMHPIEFFFLDEGFGTLDERLVDTVMDSLEKLKNKHYSIGIISHVEELKHRIDRKLTVIKATENRGSQIQAE